MLLYKYARNDFYAFLQQKQALRLYFTCILESFSSYLSTGGNTGEDSALQAHCEIQGAYIVWYANQIARYFSGPTFKIR